MEKLDRHDRLILAELKENARIRFSELARRINLSAPAVADRVARLEHIGIITGYHVSLSPTRLGLPIECLIELTCRHADYRALQARLERMPELTACYRIAGDGCVMLKAAVSDMAALQDLIDRLMEYGMTKTSIILSSPFERGLPVMGGQTSDSR